MANRERGGAVIATVITTVGLTRRFGDKVAVDGLDLEVASGEIFGVLGHNGAGKTTTVRLLNGVLEPSAGRARVLGLDPTREGAQLRGRTGVLTETPALDERLSAWDNLSFYAELYDVPRRRVRERIEALLEGFDLLGVAREKVGSFSKGMKQRLALARVLLHDPELIFLDEPTAGLDPIAARQVADLVRKLSYEGRTIFLCTHNLVEAQALCDRVAVLEHGKLVALGTPEELARDLSAGLTLELELAPESVERALGLLSVQPDLDNVAQEGTVIRLSVLNREVVPDLVTALAQAEVRIYRVAPQEISLEDVYFSLHNKEVRA
jgi:ABC-2 type transport system ATP-binding protein